MAFTQITLTNGRQSKVAPAGFSWTFLLFGAFVPLFRGDFLNALGFFVLSIVANLILPGAAFFVALGGAFIYNKYYINQLLDKGYTLYSLGGVTADSFEQKTGIKFKGNKAVIENQIEQVQSRIDHL